MILIYEIEQLFKDTGIMLDLYDAVCNEEVALEVCENAIEKARKHD